jgi:hypothetical protein
MSERTAACSCGQLTANTRTDPIRVSVCHCLACQRRTGSVFGAQARFHRDDVQTQGRSTAYVRTGDSGGRATFHFCPDCGATVYYTVEGMQDMMGIPVGAFADPTFPPPVRSVYEERIHAWVKLPDGVEHEF